MGNKYIIERDVATHFDKDLLYHLYWGLGWSADEIARYTIPESRSAISSQMKRYGIPMRSHTDSQIDRHFRRYERDGEVLAVDSEGYLTIDRRTDVTAQWGGVQRAVGD